jgi:biopolymer transport protein ExbB/TolQ
MNLTDSFLQFSLLGAEWVLWLLVILSIVSVYVMLERLLFFRSLSNTDAAIRRPLLEDLAAGDFEGAVRRVDKAVGPGGRMVSELLGQASRSSDAVEAAVAGVRAEEKLRLERNLSFLGTLGANAPFIGLFGTVLGIIRAFEDLAQSGLKPGGDQSAVVMAGISEALVATAVGLLVAIPAVVAYNVFQRRVKRMLAMADAIAGSVYPFVLGGTSGAREDD